MQIVADINNEVVPSNLELIVPETRSRDMYFENCLIIYFYLLFYIYLIYILIYLFSLGTKYFLCYKRLRS